VRIQRPGLSPQRHKVHQVETSRFKGFPSCPLTEIAFVVVQDVCGRSLAIEGLCYPHADDRVCPCSAWSCRSLTSQPGLSWPGRPVVVRAYPSCTIMAPTAGGGRRKPSAFNAPQASGRYGTLPASPYPKRLPVGRVIVWRTLALSPDRSPTTCARGARARRYGARDSSGAQAHPPAHRTLGPRPAFCVEQDGGRRRRSGERPPRRA
jgi:hypothetical protein